MVVKWIAACPVNQLDIRVGHAFAVIVDRLTRFKKHISDASHRNIGGYGVLALGDFSSAVGWQFAPKKTHVMNTTIAIGDTTAGFTHVTQH